MAVFLPDTCLSYRTERKTPPFRAGDMSESLFSVCSVADCWYTVGPTEIYACGAAVMPKLPMLVSDWFGLPIQQ
jgi:hypothetical protein